MSHRNLAVFFFFFLFKKESLSWVWWHMPVISATQEVKTGESKSEASPVKLA
jgi:hypothetical protein